MIYKAVVWLKTYQQTLVYFQRTLWLRELYSFSSCPTETVFLPMAFLSDNALDLVLKKYFYMTYLLVLDYLRFRDTYQHTRV